ncbi:MAG: FAD/NAD(P)-binding protein [Actinobacteria bacterium]|nr:FAD/NAD(P)-binding protein [Actinomycetota bacterium]MCL6087088.1 FAD/NAD(P)-binding protein [Actinomycetota bacterium]
MTEISNKQNHYLPNIASITRKQKLTETEKLFEIRFNNEVVGNSFNFKPGQFVEVSVFSIGEAPISICSSPTKKGFFQVCIRNVGNLTNTIHKMQEGSIIGIRGPYGNGFPVEAMIGNDLLFIAGGIGLAPLRSLINYILDERTKFKNVTILYGAKNPAEILFESDIKWWQERNDVDLRVTVDNPNNHWSGEVGVVTKFIPDIQIHPTNTYAIICGPPIMYKFVVKELLKKRFIKENIFVSLERLMKCGIGKCGHCGVGYKYTCIDGPVFNYWDVLNLQEAI